jgi:hypothetical protein
MAATGQWACLTSPELTEPTQADASTGAAAWLAAGLVVIVGSHVLATAVVSITVLIAAFSFVQEVQADRAVGALAKYLPQTAKVQRAGVVIEIDASQIVPGDVVIDEGDRGAADLPAPLRHRCRTRGCGHGPRRRRLRLNRHRSGSRAPTKFADTFMPLEQSSPAQ